MRGLLTNPSLALESIDFQGLGFFKELTVLFTEMASVKPAELPESELVAAMVKCITRHTGLTINVSLDEYDPCVEFPALDKNNILVNAGIKQWASSSDGIRLIANAEDGLARGTVNIKTGKVTGVFAEAKTTMHLPVTMVTNGKFTAEEMAAITLHEVGHVFTYMEYASRTLTTNQALAGLSKALDGSDSVKEREAVLIAVKKALHLKDLEIEELAQSNNKRVTEVVVVTQIARQATHELGCNIYDFSSWEYLADQYAARQGAGRHIVTGLDKIMRSSGHMSFRSSIGWAAMEALKLALVIGGAALAITTGVGGFGLIASYGLILMGMDGQGDGTYDEPGARFKRVRNQVVEALKDTKLSKDDHERLEADLEAIDRVLDQVTDRVQLLGMVWNFLSPSARKTNSQRQLQQDLEALATNDLFVKAAKLRQLS